MKSICLCLLMMLPGTLLLAQKSPDFTKRYVILTQKKAAALEKQLDEAVASGFRVLCGSDTGTNQMSLILEKAEDGKTGEYRLLVDSDIRKVKHQINQAATEGFRLMPSAMLKRGNLLKNKQFMVIMKKMPDAPQFEYLVLISKLDQSMQNVLAKAGDQGFGVLAMMTGNNDDHVVFMEKEAE